MTLKSTVEALGRAAVTTTYTAARRPLGATARTTARAAGLALDTVGAGLGLVLGRPAAPTARGERPDQAPQNVGHLVEQVQDLADDAKETVARSVTAAQEKTADSVHDAPAAKDAAAKPAGVDDVAQQPTKAPAAKKAPGKRAPAAADHGSSDDPRDHIPGPDLATFAPPAPEDLPEPIVIEAE